MNIKGCSIQPPDAASKNHPSMLTAAFSLSSCQHNCIAIAPPSEYPTTPNTIEVEPATESAIWVDAIQHLQRINDLRGRFATLSIFWWATPTRAFERSLRRKIHVCRSGIAGRSTTPAHAGSS